jgi:H+/Cl- antiporter ClcA
MKRVQLVGQLGGGWSLCWVLFKDLTSWIFIFVGELQVIGSIGSVAGGLIVGKEGPLVHVGACIASLLGQGGSVRYGMTWKWLRYLKNDRDRRDLVTCGAAAGVAAAFRAPVGGVLFALEEVTSWYDKPGDLFAATLFKP